VCAFGHASHRPFASFHISDEFNTRFCFFGQIRHTQHNSPTGGLCSLSSDIKDGCCFLNPLNLEFEDLQGNALPTSPEHRVTFNANYNINFATGTAILSGTYIWRDDIYNDVFDNPEAQAPSWNQIDLRALWRDASDRYTLIAFVRNLNDSEIYTAAGAYRVATGGTPPTRIDQVFWLGAWRTYGIEVHYRFRAGT